MRHIYTFVVEFESGKVPAVSKNTDILGGTLNAVQFSDALADLEKVSEQRDGLLDAFQYLAEKADDSDDGCHGTLSTTFVRDVARAAIAKATQP